MSTAARVLTEPTHAGKEAQHGTAEPCATSDRQLDSGRLVPPDCTYFFSAILVCERLQNT